MNEEITKKLLEYMENTGDFILEQAPEVLQQALRYHYVSSILGMLLSFFLILACAMTAYYFYMHPNYNTYGSRSLESFLGTFIPSMFSLILVCCFISNADKFIQITIAPKYFLINLLR